VDYSDMLKLDACEIKLWVLEKYGSWVEWRWNSFILAGDVEYGTRLDVGVVTMFKLRVWYYLAKVLFLLIYRFGKCRI